MAGSPFLETVARDLFETEWERECAAFRDEAPVAADTCPILWLVPELVDLMEETHHQPILTIIPTIRQMLTELYFVDDVGDCVIEGANQMMIDRQVKVMLRVLDQVKRVAAARGQWSDAPVTPQMFG